MAEYDSWSNQHEYTSAESDLNSTTDASSVSGDSALGEDVPESTSSLRSSLFEGVSENGRLYHKYKEGKYVLPSDDRAIDWVWELPNWGLLGKADFRTDLQHHLFLLTTNFRLNLAPVKPGMQHVLDVGTGTGIWAIDFAQEHPDAQVLGVDLSPIQPAFVPPNCVFEIDDVEEPWTWSHKFDYIHARMMTASFRDWPKFFSQCFENLSPGGWIEMQDTDFPLQCDDDTLAPSTSLFQWGEMISRATRSIGHDLPAARYKQMLQDAGFVDVTEVRYLWPQNSWPADPKLKELGRWNLTNSLDGLQGYSMALMTRVLGMPLEEVEVMLAGVRKDMKNRRIHAYWPIYYVYGRKPDLPSRPNYSYPTYSTHFQAPISPTPSSSSGTSRTPTMSSFPQTSQPAHFSPPYLPPMTSSPLPSSPPPPSRSAPNMPASLAQAAGNATRGTPVRASPEGYGSEYSASGYAGEQRRW